MRQYIVTKEILNVRNQATDTTDETYVGHLLKGDIVWLDEEEIVGVIPRNGTTNIWLKDSWNNVVAKDGVTDAAEFWIKEFGIDELWKEANGEEVNVIVIDSGVNDFVDIDSNRLVKSSISKFSDTNDKVGHGTLMTSVISGKGNFIKGVASKVKVVSIKCAETKDFDNQDFIDALEMLPNLLKNNRFSIINCSIELGDNLEDTLKVQIQNLINGLYEKFPILFIAAVGNKGKKEDDKTIPASLDNVISCAAFRKSHNENVRLSDSNYWPTINITAPGDFPASQINNELSGQGSSQACAFTTGLVSIFISKLFNKGKTPTFNQIESLLIESCIRIETDLSYNMLDKTRLQNTFEKI
jgi:hypothetical protein